MKSGARRFSKEFYVGMFTTLAILLLAFITFSLQNWNLLSQRNTYYVYFTQVRKLDIGAPVFVYGVQVGQVNKLEYVGGKHPVRVTIAIDNDVALYENLRVSITPAGVIGDTTIGIEAGFPDKDSAQLPTGAEIIGETAVEYDELAEQLSNELMRTLKATGDILQDPEFRTSFKETVTNLASATRKIDMTADLINTELKPTITKLYETAENINNFVTSARGFTEHAGTEINTTRQSLMQTSEAWSEAARTLNRQIDETATRLQATTEKLDAMLSDNRDPVKDTIGELKAASVALREISQQLRAGEGTLGKLLVDSRPFDALSQILSSLSQSLTGRREPVFLLPEGPATRRGPEGAAPRGGEATPPTGEPKLNPTSGTRP